MPAHEIYFRTPAPHLKLDVSITNKKPCIIIKSKYNMITSLIEKIIISTDKSNYLCINGVQFMGTFASEKLLNHIYEQMANGEKFIDITKFQKD